MITDPQGTIVEITSKKNAGDDVQVFNGILCPGFINSHCHIELSHMKGIIPQQTGLVEFVQQVMRKRETSAEEKQNAIFLAEKELYNSGTIAVGDICNTIDSLHTKQKSTLHWHNFIEVTGFVDAAAESRMENAKVIQAKFQIANSKLQNSLSPHSPYSVSKTLFNLLNNETRDQLITIHNQESEAENELYKNKSGGFLSLYKNFGIDVAGFQPTGKSSLQSWFPYFTNHQSLILVHNTFISQEDLDFAKLQTTNNKLQTNFCLCPNANLYIENKMPPIELLRKNNCNILIGTDSYASNTQLNILEELKTIRQKFAAIPLHEMLQWCTINGAKALQMDNKLGTFDKGKQPGVVLIERLNELMLTKKSSAKRII